MSPKNMDVTKPNLKLSVSNSSHESSCVYARAFPHKYTYTSNSGEAKETEFTGYRTVTTGSCPNVDCVGSYGSWNNCYQVDGMRGGRKYGTYTIFFNSSRWSCLDSFSLLDGMVHISF